MRDHTDLLNMLAAEFKLQSYLEIGVQHPDANFNRITIPNKMGVDPEPNAKATHCMTSDEFFENLREEVEFDLIFIDGLHHSDQVRKDFNNSLRFLSEKGFIVIHDSAPHSESFTHVPRDSKIWTGDVYKFICTLSTDYVGINFRTLDFDHGCCVIWNDVRRKRMEDITFNYFERNRYLIRPIQPTYENIITAIKHD